MMHNSRFMAEDAARAARDADHAAALANFRAERARLLENTYEVGADAYTSEFFLLKNRPAAELSYQGRQYQTSSSLHRLPNGDWLELVGPSWTRHTYDRELAIDRARRNLIGGYTIRPDIAEAMRELISVGAHRMRIGAMWQELPRHLTYIRAFSGSGNLYAGEACTSWIHYLSEECLVLHPDHADLIRRVIALLGEPDALREFPAEIDPKIYSIIRELEGE